MYAADVDGDGDMDALSASIDEDRIAWYENTIGDGSSWVLHIINNGAGDVRSVYAADVEGDGDVDCCATCRSDDGL